MKKVPFLIPLCCLALSISCKTETSKNNEGNTQTKEPAPISVQKGNTYAEISVKEGGKWVNKKYEGGNEFKNIQSLKVPKEHTDHSNYIRYEGPGWESNKVGYRLYLDWRNAIDIFGKKTDEMVLPNVGQDSVGSYHEMSDWGMDVLKVGNSLGIGSIGRYKNGKVLHFEKVDSTFVNIENTEKASSVYIDYHGWATDEHKIDLSSKLTITPNHRYTKHAVTPSKAIEGICTGFVKFEGIDLKKERPDAKWAYIATYGTQTLVPDKLGMVIFYKISEVENVIEGPDDHLIIFKPTHKTIVYYFLGAWEKEKNGITNKEDFIAYIDQLLEELNSNDSL